MAGRVSIALAMMLVIVGSTLGQLGASWLAGGLSVALGLSAVLGLGGLVVWARRPQPGWALLAVAPVAATAWLERLASPSGVHHVKFLPAAALLFWAIGSWRSTEARGREAAAGVVAACYGLAALSKIVLSGWAWFEPANLGLLILERSVGAPAPLAALRLWVATQPAVCAGLAIGALLIELAGLLFVIPRLRIGLTVAFALLHLGIALLMGYVYLPWVLVAGGISLSSGAGSRAAGR